MMRNLRVLITSILFLVAIVHMPTAHSSSTPPHCNTNATDSVSTESLFIINSARIVATPALMLFIERLDSISETGRRARIFVHGTASPDGPEAWNERLSYRRASAIRDFLLSHTDIPPTSISATGLGEDWDATRKASEQLFSPEDYAEIAQIIATIPSPAQRERALRRLQGGRIWERLRSDVFPNLRRVSITALYQTEQPISTAKDTPNPVEETESYAPDTLAQTVTKIIETVPAEQSSPATTPSERPPHWYLKTNLPAWGMLWMNVAVEIDINRHLSAQLPIYYSGFNYFSGDVKFRTLAIQPELRFWPGSGGERKAFVGVHFGLGWYNVAFGGDTRYQDHNRRTPAIGGGISAGYRFRFTRNPRWEMEASIGAGCYRLDYDHFENRHNGRIIGRTQRTFFGIDQAALSVSYSFNLGKSKGGAL